MSEISHNTGPGTGVTQRRESELYRGISRLHIINHSVNGEMRTAHIREIWITSPSLRPRPGFYICGIVKDGSDVVMKCLYSN